MRFFAVLMAMLMMTSCAAASDKSSTTASSRLAAEDYMPIQTAAAAPNAMMEGESAYDMSSKVTMDFAAGEGTAAPLSAKTASQTTEKKIIKNGNVDIEAEDVQESYQKFLDYIVSQGGYEFSKNLSNSSDYSNLSATVKVPPDKLDAVLEYARECGKVINVNISMNDITMSYTDTEIRLENKRKNLEKYYEFYEKAGTMEEMIAIQAQIDSITAEIESYEGQLKYWNSQIDESTLSIYIQEAADPNKIPEDIDWSSLSLSSMGKLISNGFVSVVNGIVTFFQWIVIIVASISPVLIAAAVIVFIVVRRNRKKKQASAPTKPQASETESK